MVNSPALQTFLVFMTSIFLLGQHTNTNAAKNKAPTVPFTLNATIKRVIDGDTVKLNTAQGTFMVRIRGIDTPEVYKAKTACEKALGKKATRYAKTLFPKGSAAKLITNGIRGYYGRVLGDVCNAQGVCWAKAMLASKHARPYRAGQTSKNWC